MAHAASYVARQEPEFFGANTKQGLDIQEFVRRVDCHHVNMPVPPNLAGDALRDARTRILQQVSETAVTWLRGMAYDWFTITLRLSEPARHTQCLLSWTELKKELLTTFAKTRGITSVPLTFQAIKQLPDEKFINYHVRLTKQFDLFMTHLPEMVLPEPDSEDFRETRDTFAPIVATAGITNDIRNDFTEGNRNDIARLIRKGQWQMLYVQATKFLADGVFDPRVRKLILAEELAGTSFFAICKKMEVEEEISYNKGKGKVSSIQQEEDTTANDTTSLHTEEEEDVTAAALTAGKKKTNNRKGKGSKNKKGGKPNSIQATSNPPPVTAPRHTNKNPPPATYYCDYCKRPGHSTDFCSAKKQSDTNQEFRQGLLDLKSLILTSSNRAVNGEYNKHFTNQPAGNDNASLC